MMKLYVYEIGSKAEADAAVAAGADAIGIRLSYRGDQLRMERIREVFCSLPPFLSRVGIFQEEQRWDIDEMCSFCHLQGIHFCLPYAESDTGHHSEYAIGEMPVEQTADFAKYHLDAAFLRLSAPLTAAPEIGKRRLILAGTLSTEDWRQTLALCRPYALALTPAQLAGEEGRLWRELQRERWAEEEKG